MAARRLLALFAVLSVLASGTSGALADPVETLVTVGGAPDNQLVGFGLVIGLPGTGDQTTQIPYTQEAVSNMLSHEGVTLPSTAFMQPNDVASVMVTATVPPFSGAGTALDATVAAIGNATSLAGGVLLPTPLKGGNGLIYAQAQGPLLVSGFAVGAGGSSTRTNTPTVGRLNGGAILARGIPTDVGAGGHIDLLLNQPDFTNAARIAKAINNAMGYGTAVAVSPGDVALTDSASGNVVNFLASVMSVDVTPATQIPTVVVDAQSGTIVMGAGVELGPAVVSHGTLTVAIQTVHSVSQPNAFGNGQTVGVTNSAVSANQTQAHVIELPKAVTLGEIASALNEAGATPSDLIAIVEALQDAGALKARLKVV